MNIEQHTIGEEPGQGHQLVKAWMEIARRYWLYHIRRLLGKPAAVLCGQRWSIGAPFGAAEWPLTDHPSLRVNYYGPTQYDFEGGFGKRGSEIFMPISLRHMLYLKVGSKLPSRFTFPAKQTHIIQRLLVERAHRWVVGTRPYDVLVAFRPRIINRDQGGHEREEWLKYHRIQVEVEKASAVRVATRNTTTPP